jgi:invasion protein IalB
VVGCIVRMGVTFEELDAMKAGSTATLTIAPFVQVDQPVDITVSLSGFTAMFEDLQTRLSLAAAAARSGN